MTVAAPSAVTGAAGAVDTADAPLALAAGSAAGAVAAAAVPVVFVLDGREVLAQPGQSLLDVARREGIDVPHLCHRDGLTPAGNCRACVVEIAGERVLAASCCRAPAAGMRVSTGSDRVRQAQRMVLELLRSDLPPGRSHGELDRWAAAALPGAAVVESVDHGTVAVAVAGSGTGIGIGIGTLPADPVFSRAAAAAVDTSLAPAAASASAAGEAPAARLPARANPAPDRSHPAIAVDMSLCIQCTRCVRACRDVQGNDVIGLAGRGEHARIVFDLDDALGASTCVACGECVQACPTGALVSRVPGADDVAGAAVAASSAGASVGIGDVFRAQAGAHADATTTALPMHATTPTPTTPTTTPTTTPAASPTSPPAPTAVDSLCPYCGVGCQVTYRVRDDRIVGVDGRRGPANDGRLCVKGRYGFDYVRHPQRLTVPLVRRAGAPKRPDAVVDPARMLDDFREAGWDEALALAAGGFKRLRDTHGPDALAGFGSAKGSNEEAYLFQKLVRTGFGSHHVDHCTRLCHASSVAALLEGIGSGAVSNPVRDVLDAEVVLIIGANPAVNHPVAASFIKNAVRRGTKLILCDPRRGELARHAHRYLAFTPGSDVALLNALMHVIVAEGLVDEAFVAARTEGFEAMKAHLAAYSPEAMAPLCGIDAATLREVARLYAGSRASMILWGMGVSQHVHGTDNARCLIALALMTGQIGRRGTGLHPLRGQNNVQGASDAGLIPMMLPDYQPVTDPAVRARFERAWHLAPGTLPAQPGLTVVEVLRAAEAGTMRGLYVMGENPAMSDPDARHARAALARLEHMVVQDLFLTETAALADVVLPAGAFAEKTGSFTNTDRTVQLARAALAPPGQARQDWELLQAMARGLGLDWRYQNVGEVFDEMRLTMPSIAGITWERLQRDGAVTYPCEHEGDPGQAVVFTDGFPRPGGRARFVPAAVLPPDERPDAEYPLVLITGRQLEHWHTGSMTRRAAVLDALEPDPTVQMHPADMAAVGLVAGGAATLVTRRGAVTVYVRADDGTPPGSVFMAFCWTEAAANLLTNPALDPVAKIPEFKHCAVRVEPGGTVMPSPRATPVSLASEPV